MANWKQESDFSSSRSSSYSSSFSSLSLLPQKGMLGRCVSLHHRAQSLFFFFYTKYINTPKKPKCCNHTYRLFANQDFERVSCALHCLYRSEQSTVSLQSYQITTLVISAETTCFIIRAWSAWLPIPLLCANIHLSAGYAWAHVPHCSLILRDPVYESCSHLFFHPNKQRCFLFECFLLAGSLIQSHCYVGICLCLHCSVTTNDYLDH